MARLALRGIEKTYGPDLVNSIDEITVAEGEVLSLLGPSGCGKTTVLRIIAGLVQQDRGDVFFDDRLMNQLPPERRNTAMVFQNYALFPHLSIFENVAFGLRVRRHTADQIQRRVGEALELVRLVGLEKRLPHQLSGGQQQRVALARAVAINPEVLLFDEPLSNLDARLREEMRAELREFLVKLRITSIYVTHDQAEAVVVSDRIAVMEKGRVRQVGEPQAIYDQPASRFVASFMGQARFVRGQVTEKPAENGLSRLTTGDGLAVWARSGAPDVGQEALVAVRPEGVKVFPRHTGPQGGQDSLPAQVESALHFGDHTDYTLRLGSWKLLCKVLACEHRFQPGDLVLAVIDPYRCAIVSPDEVSTDT